MCIRDRDGDAYAQYIIGTAYRDGGLLIPDTVKAQKLLERAADQDLDAAQYALGKLYLLSLIHILSGFVIVAVLR